MSENMSTYSLLSSLFQLSRNLKTRRKILNNEEKKKLSEDFINLCNQLLSNTVNTEDEKFMIISFISVNEDIINWSLEKCPEKANESFKMYKYNLFNEKKLNN